jgi:hypothetical protein
MVARLGERPVKTAIEGTAGTSLAANPILPPTFLHAPEPNFNDMLLNLLTIVRQPKRPATIWHPLSLN